MHTDHFEVSGKYGDKNYNARVLNMQHKHWVNLVGMILFLLSAMMGATFFWIGRRAAKSSGLTVV
jgi:TRAP-type mannitol/chloroaromatic compound transport system permease small subunit